MMVDSFFSMHLRWVLLGLGLVCFVGIYLYTTWSWRRDKVPFEQKQEPAPIVQQPPPAELSKEQTAGQFNKQAEGFSPLSEDIDLSRADQHAQPERLEGSETTDAPPSSVEERVVALYVEARGEGESISGQAIETFIETHNLVREGSEKEGFLSNAHGSFFVANLFEPGIFYWAEMKTMSIKGLSFFFRLPLEGQSSGTCAHDVFSEMSQCAIKFAQHANAKVYDNEHVLLNDASFRKLEEDMRRYDEKNT